MDIKQEVSQKLDQVLNQAVSKLSTFDYDSLLEDMIVEKNMLIAHLMEENRQLKEEVKKLLAVQKS